jgi:hypothetical protein
MELGEGGRQPTPERLWTTRTVGRRPVVSYSDVQEPACAGDVERHEGVAVRAWEGLVTWQGSRHPLRNGVPMRARQPATEHVQPVASLSTSQPRGVNPRSLR